jgi:spore germination protein GerM
MKNKKIIMYVGIILIVLILLFIGYLIINNIKGNNKQNIYEYTPEEEITGQQLRQTIITLYFLDPNTQKLLPEARQIDAKELLDNPYELLINLLIEGPKNPNLLKLIPENTKLNSAQIKNNILYIDFSEDFIKEQNLGKEQEELILKSIVNTLTELAEINKIVILIDGKEGLRISRWGSDF